MPKKILIVCLGNICRSPLAEGILRKMIKEKGLDVEIDSAGMESFHAGEAPDSRTQKNASSHGIDLSGLRARQFTPDDFDRFDKIFVMDRYNYIEIMSMVRNKADELKVSMIMDYLYPNGKKSVPDPYLGGEDGFEEVYQLLNSACMKITDLLSENKL